MWLTVAPSRSVKGNPHRPQTSAWASTLRLLRAASDDESCRLSVRCEGLRWIIWLRP